LARIIRDSAVTQCDFKEVPPVLLGILQGCSLVYDGWIVINALFWTNDPKIFAAGRVTMFSRLYRVKYDGNAISETGYGNQIDATILKFVDPLARFEEPTPIIGPDDVKNLVKAKGPQSVPKFSTRGAEVYIFFAKKWSVLSKWISINKGPIALGFKGSTNNAILH
jgi:hypothetical protein